MSNSHRVTSVEYKLTLCQRACLLDIHRPNTARWVGLAVVANHTLFKDIRLHSGLIVCHFRISNSMRRTYPRRYAEDYDPYASGNENRRRNRDRLNMDILMHDLLRSSSRRGHGPYDLYPYEPEPSNLGYRSPLRMFRGHDGSSGFLRRCRVAFRPPFFDDDFDSDYDEDPLPGFLSRHPPYCVRWEFANPFRSVLCGCYVDA